MFCKTLFLKIYMCIAMCLCAKVMCTGISTKLDFGELPEKGSESHHHTPRASESIISQRRYYKLEPARSTTSSTIEIVNKISIKDSNSGETKTCESCENAASQVVITGKADDKIVTDIKISLESGSQKTDKNTEVNAENVSDDDDVPVYVGLNGVNTPSSPVAHPQVAPAFTYHRGIHSQPSFKPIKYYPSNRDDSTINSRSFEKPRNSQYFEYRLGDWVPCTCGWQQNSWNGGETPKLPVGPGSNLGSPNFSPGHGRNFAPPSFVNRDHSFVNYHRPSYDPYPRGEGWNRRQDWHTTERVIIDDKLQAPFSNTYKGVY